MARETHREYNEKGMLGPYSFDQEMIDDIDEDEYGVYLLTHEAEDDESIIVVVYVGRGIIQDRLAESLVLNRRAPLNRSSVPLNSLQP